MIVSFQGFRAEMMEKVRFASKLLSIFSVMVKLIGVPKIGSQKAV